jgi:hypothetical protein
MRLSTLGLIAFAIVSIGVTAALCLPKIQKNRAWGEVLRYEGQALRSGGGREKPETLAYQTWSGATLEGEVAFVMTIRRGRTDERVLVLCTGLHAWTAFIHLSTGLLQGTSVVFTEPGARLTSVRESQQSEWTVSCIELQWGDVTQFYSLHYGALTLVRRQGRDGKRLPGELKRYPPREKPAIETLKSPHDDEVLGLLFWLDSDEGQEFRARPDVKEQIAELAKSRNAWIADAAKALVGK